MNPTLSIARRELRSYFSSVTAYIVIALFLLIAGGLFWLEIFNAASTELSMRSFFGRAPFFLAFFAPAISMGLLSEEQRAKTLELLMTLPVTDTQVVVGKFLAALTLLAVVLAATIPYPLTLSTLGDLDWGPVIGGYVGLLLLGAAYLSVGVLVSALTRDQMVSILVSFFFCFALNIMGELASHTSGTLATLLTFISTSGHFENVARGVIDTRDVVYYLTIVVLSLSAASVVISRRRW
jgi:ABC-2 type transport system permease protein